MEKQSEFNYSRQKKSSFHYWLFGILSIGIGLLIAFILAEFTCRLLNVGHPNLTLTGPKQLYISDPDPKIAFRMRPGYEDFVYGAQIKINEKGLRDKNLPYKKPKGKKRILILGDSVAFGYGVPVQDTFADQWEGYLSQVAPNKWEIINSGVPAYTTVQEVRWFEVEGLSYRPDAVVVCYVMNDPEPVHQLAEDGNFIPQDIDKFYKKLAELIPKPILPFTDFSFFLNYTNRVLLYANPKWHVLHDELVHYFCEEIFTTPGWEECKSAFQHLQGICKKEGIFLLVAVYPMMYRLHSLSGHPFSPHYEKISHYLESQGVLYVVPLEKFIGESMDDMRAYVDDPHPSGKSHEIFAKSLHDAMENEWNEYDLST